MSRIAYLNLNSLQVLVNSNNEERVMSTYSLHPFLGSRGTGSGERKMGSRETGESKHKRETEDSELIVQLLLILRLFNSIISEVTGASS